MTDLPVVLNPLLLRKQTEGSNSGIKAIAELLLIDAIGRCSDQLVLRSVDGVFGSVLRIDGNYGEVFPFPRHVRGITVNYYRKLFCIEFPSREGSGIVTLGNNRFATVSCKIGSIMSKGLATLDISNSDIRRDDCDAVLQSYFIVARAEKSMFTRMYDDIRGWMTGHALQPYDE